MLSLPSPRSPPMTEKMAEERVLRALGTATMRRKEYYQLVHEIRDAVETERKEWHKLVATLMKNLPWGALKGALLEDSRVKEAIRKKPADD